jgi:hypothetical protein
MRITLRPPAKSGKFIWRRAREDSGTELMPGPIAWLMDLANRQADHTSLEIVRNYFNRLGSGLIDQFAGGERGRAIRGRGKTLRECDETLRKSDEGLREPVRAGDEVVKDRDLRIARLTKDLAER